MYRYNALLLKDERDEVTVLADGDGHLEGARGLRDAAGEADSEWLIDRFQTELAELDARIEHLKIAIPANAE